MKLALISPRSCFLGHNPEFRAFFTHSPEMEFYRRYWSGLGLGLLVIAALTPPEIEIDLIDENLEEIDFDHPYDLVGVTAMTQQATRAYEIADVFRSRGRTVVLGGIHATVLPDEAAQHSDSVVVGEAELLWPGLIRDFTANNLQKVYRTSDEVDLSLSPVPSYELLDKRDSQVIWVQTSRGCPHDCSFCCASRVYGSKYRRCTIEHVRAALHKIRTVNPRAMLGFADDSLFAHHRHAREILTLLQQEKIRWIGQSDISIAAHDDMLDSLRASGCVALFVGLESIDEVNLKGLDAHNWKLQQRATYERSISRIQSRGIGVFGAFIVGFDNDDSTTFDHIADFVRDNHLAGAQIAALTPFPQTRLRTKLAEQGRILDHPWENYTLYDSNIRPLKMSPAELESGVLRAFQNVYSRENANTKTRHFKKIFSHLRRNKK